MIEVIKPGTKNRVECNNCGSLLSYSVDDIKLQEKYLSQRDSYNEKYIICPQCNFKIVLEGMRWEGK